MSVKKTTKRLYRSKDDKVIAGVCGGIGQYFEIDPVIIRLIWAIFAIAGVGILAYIIAWIIIPKEN